MSTTTDAPTDAPTDARRGGTPMRPAKQVTGAGPVGRVGPLLAVLLTLLGLLLLRDGIFAPAGSRTTGWPADEQSWLMTATTPFDGLARAGWLVPVGVVVALVGLHLLAVALRRRTRRAMALCGGAGAYLLPADAARRASAAARDVDGVLSASASATRSRVSVKVATTGSAAARQAVSQAVSAAVTDSLAALARSPRVSVRATSTDSGTDDGNLA